MAANDGAGNDLFAFQAAGNTNVQYLRHPALATPSLATATTLSASCNSPPSGAYSLQGRFLAMARVANDTKNMRAATYFPATSKVNPYWTFLGQPSSSVSLMPGDSVGIGNIAGDPGYVQVMCIAEGADKGMRLSEVNAAQTTYLSKVSGWMNVLLPGIFNSYASASFENHEARG
jgi:hypothetical protein